MARPNIDKVKAQETAKKTTENYGMLQARDIYDHPLIHLQFRSYFECKTSQGLAILVSHSGIIGVSPADKISITNVCFDPSTTALLSYARVR
jgi:hypothetical protein